MWIIKEKQSVGPLCIGNKIIDLEEEFGNTFDTFKRVPDDKDTVYAFDKHGIHLTCGQDEKVKVISVFRPNKVSYLDVQLLDREILRVKEELQSKDINLEEVDVGFWIEEAGLLLVDYEGKVDGIELYS